MRTPTGGRRNRAKGSAYVICAVIRAARRFFRQRAPARGQQSVGGFGSRAPTGPKVQVETKSSAP